MKKKPKVKQQPEYQRILERWSGRLLLNEWMFSFVEEKDQAAGRYDDRDCLAQISVDPVYLTARITIYPAWHRKHPAVREHAIVHELCHCFTQEVWDHMGSLRNGVLVPAHQATDSIERLTQRIANAVFWRDGRSPK